MSTFILQTGLSVFYCDRKEDGSRCCQHECKNYSVGESVVLGIVSLLGHKLTGFVAAVVFGHKPSSSFFGHKLKDIRFGPQPKLD